MRYENPTAREATEHRTKGGAVEVWDVKGCRWTCSEIGDMFLGYVSDPDVPQVGMRLVPLPPRHFRPGENVHHVNNPEVKYRIGSEVDDEGMVLVFDANVEDPYGYVHPMRYGSLVLDSGRSSGEDAVPYRGETR